MRTPAVVASFLEALSNVLMLRNSRSLDVAHLPSFDEIVAKDHSLRVTADGLSRSFAESRTSSMNMDSSVDLSLGASRRPGSIIGAHVWKSSPKSHLQQKATQRRTGKAELQALATLREKSRELEAENAKLAVEATGLHQHVKEKDSVFADERAQRETQSKERIVRQVIASILTFHLSV